MIITIKHYDKTAQVEIKEDQYKESGIDDTTAEEAVEASLDLLKMWYGENNVNRSAEQYAADRISDSI